MVRCLEWAYITASLHMDTLFKLLYQICFATDSVGKHSELVKMVLCQTGAVAWFSEGTSVCFGRHHSCDYFYSKATSLQSSSVEMNFDELQWTLGVGHNLISFRLLGFHLSTAYLTGEVLTVVCLHIDTQIASRCVLNLTVCFHCGKCC